MNTPGNKLFTLLPAFHRIRDAQLAEALNGFTPADAAQLKSLLNQQGPLPPDQQLLLEQLTAKSQGPLQSLLAVVEEQLAVVAENLNQFYDDQFIETCAPWVIPYIGDLIGYQSLNTLDPALNASRADVANTISFRRRKGTVLVMEQLARDTTSWGAHAVEFFRHLADTQYMNHIRLENHYAPDLRQWQPGFYVDTGFDRTAHKVDVRRIASGRGRYNIQNIGIFLWSLNAYSVTNVTATPVAASSPGGPLCYRFSSLGMDIPLFHKALSQGANITAPAQPVNVPDRLRRRALCADIQRGVGSFYYGANNSLAISVNDTPYNAWQIQVCDLSGPDGQWANLPPPGSPYTALDPELGRIAFAADSSPPPQTVEVSYQYGFNADLGGGEYARAATFTASPDQVIVRVPHDATSISAALSLLPGDGVVEVSDSGIYTENDLQIYVAAHGHIELRAADSARPTLLLSGPISVTGGAVSAFDLNGFVIAYVPPPGGGVSPPALLHVPDASPNQLAHLGLTHCTLTPGWAVQSDGEPQPAYAGLPAVLVELPGLEAVVQNSILGALWINGQATATLTNCILDAIEPTGVAYVAGIDATTLRPMAGGALTLQGCTVVGKVYASLLTLVSNSIIWAELTAAETAGSPPILWSAALWSARKQQGCVRFSFLPVDSNVPRQFKCVVQGDGTPEPIFHSLRYGRPGYAKLLPDTDSTIRQGAEDGGEMGAFHFVLAPLREQNLRIRMQEYIPVGMEFGIYYQT